MGDCYGLDRKCPPKGQLMGFGKSLDHEGVDLINRPTDDFIAEWVVRWWEIQGCTVGGHTWGLCLTPGPLPLWLSPSLLPACLAASSSAPLHLPGCDAQLPMGWGKPATVGCETSGI